MLSSSIAMVTFITPVELALPDYGDAMSTDQAYWYPSSCPSTCQCELQTFVSFPEPLRTASCSSLPTAGILSGLAEPFIDIPLETEALILSELALQALPEQMPHLPDLLLLDLSGNQLTQPPVVRALSRNIRVLILNDNPLETIRKRHFKGFPRLRELSLRSCRISSIETGAFGPLTRHLEFLDLSSNLLTFIHPEWWGVKQPHSLYELRLASNHLRLLQNGVFRGMPRLSSLVLERNFISRIHQHAFDGVHELAILDLSDNSIAPADAASFEPLIPTLRALDLSGNPSFSQFQFSNYPLLREIRLSGIHGLRYVDSGTFSNLPSLISLELHDNPGLTYLDPDAIQGAPALTHLSLHNNNLTIVPEAVSLNVPSLTSLSFYGNPIRCDCGAAWIHRIIYSDNDPNRLRFVESDHITCAFPDIHRFRLFSSLGMDDLIQTCAPSLTQVTLLSFPETSEVQVRLGEPIELQCRGSVSSLNPMERADLTWLTPSGERVPSGSLTIPRSGIADSGFYECVDAQSSGSVLISVDVLPLDVRLTTALVRAHSATLEWSGADRDQHAFHIFYQALDASQFSKAAVVTPIMKSLTLGNLNPDTLYKACLSLSDSADPSSQIIHLNCVQFETPSDPSYRVGLVLNVSLGATATLLIIAAAIYIRHFTPVCIGKAHHCNDEYLTDSVSSGATENPNARSAEVEVVRDTSNNFYRRLLGRVLLCNAATAGASSIDPVTQSRTSVVEITPCASPLPRDCYIHSSKEMLFV